MHYSCRGAELFQATIVKAVKARLEEENKSMEQLKRQWDLFLVIYYILLRIYAPIRQVPLISQCGIKPKKGKQL